MYLNFKVNNQILKRNDNNILVNKSRNYLHCQFSFESEDWEDITKFAIFKNEYGENFSVYLGNNNSSECVVPSDALIGDFFRVSLYGGDLITTNELTIVLLKSGYTTNIFENTVEQKDILVEIFEKIESKISKIVYDQNNLYCYNDDKLLYTLELDNLSVNWNDIKNKPDMFPPEEHEHIVNDISDFKSNIDSDFDFFISDLTENIRKI